MTTTSLWTDAHLAKLAATFTRCEADLKRIGLKADTDSQYYDPRTELRSECGAISIKFGRDFTADDHGIYAFTVNFNPYGFNIWGKTQPMDEALEMARLNLTIVSLASQWDAEFIGQRFAQDEMQDPAKVAAAKAEWDAENEVSEAARLLRTDRRVEVFAKVSAGDPRDGAPGLVLGDVILTANDRRVAKSLEALMVTGDSISFHLTDLGKRVAASMEEQVAA